MQGSISVVKTVKTKMRDQNFERDRKREKTRSKKQRKVRGNDKRRMSFDD